MKEWQELDVNEVIELIYENITDPNPELRDELYALVSAADQLLQEKNNAR
jgi:hypothetical protein